MAIELRVLGELSWRGNPVPGARVRALFDALVARAPSGCSAGELADFIWDDAAPANPKKALQVLVARARSATSPHVIESTPAGYRLGLNPELVDLLACRQIVDDARDRFDSGDVAQASELIATAKVVGGPSLSDDAGVGFEVRKLGALIEAQTKPSAAVVDELERLVAQSPDDEQLLSVLFRALSRVRGPSHALDAYAEYRDELLATRGMSPGPLLQAVERELLWADEPVRRGLRHDGGELLGRESDLRNLKALLAKNRIVSILGTGGLGKTRLAQAVGRVSERPIVNFVDLTAVSASDDVLLELANALEIPVSTSQGYSVLRTNIARSLDRAPTLLILDNCEQIIDQIADIAAFLIASTADLQILTTTRTALNIAGENLYHLDALEVSAAVDLFGARARAARASAELPEPEVVALVTELEGIPLAIELAAAKIRGMSVAQIRARLRDRFEFLRGSSRSSPDRHQTMFAVLDWSWNLLTEYEQQALGWLALLPDGVSPTIAGQFLQPVGGELVAEALIDQSLLNVTEVSGDVRYRMFEAVREFAIHKLAASGGDYEAALAARAKWAHAYAARYRNALHAEEQIAAMAAVRAEETNLTEAAQHAVDEDRAEVAFGVLATLAWYWVIAGKYQRVMAYFQALETRVSTWKIASESVEEARIAVTALLIPQTLGVQFEGRALRQILEENGPAQTLDSARGFGEVLLALDTSDPQVSIEKLEAFGQSDDPAIAMPALQGLAYMYENNGDSDSAARVVERSLALSDPVKRPWPRAMQQVLLAQLHVQLGDHETARGYASGVFDVLNELGAIEELRTCHAIYAVAALQSGDIEAAENEIETLAKYDKRHGYLDSSIVTLGRAELALIRGDIETGLALFEKWRERGLIDEIPGLLENPEFAPWVLFSDASTLVALARYGDLEHGRELFELMRTKLVKLVQMRLEKQDYPALGMVVYAVGAWGLLRGDLPAEQAVRFLGLAKAMSYNQISPSMAWGKIVEPAETAAPGVLAEVAQQTRGQLGRALLPALREVLES